MPKSTCISPLEAKIQKILTNHEARQTRGKARQTRGKREVSELRVRVASIRIALFKLFCTCTQLGLCARIVFAPVLQNIRQKLLVFGKLVVSTATAHFEIATKFDTVVKLAGFQ